MPQTFEEMGPFAGLMELPSPKHISTKHFVAASNVQQRGGMVCPRPGYDRALTAPLTNVGVVKSGVTAAAFICKDGTAYPNTKLYFTYGTKIATVKADGSAFSNLYTTGSTQWYGIAIDTIPATDTLYICDYGGYKIQKGDVASGALTTIIDRTATGYRPYAITIDAAGGFLYFSEQTATVCRIVRCTTAGASPTVLYTTSVATHRIGGVSVDVANSRVYFSVNLSSLIGGYIFYVPTGGGSNVSVWLEANNPVDVNYNASDSRLYYADYNRVSYLSLTSGVGTDSTIVASFNPSTYGPNGCVVDSTQQAVYIADVTGGNILSVDSTNIIIGGTWIKRAILPTTATTETDDVFLYQTLNTKDGGSKFSAFLPSSLGHSVPMTPGYTVGSGSDPDTFVMISRTSDPSALSPIVAGGNWGRGSYAWTGTGLDTYEGGMIVCASTGAYVFNYLVNDLGGDGGASNVQTVTIRGGATGGTFTISLHGTATVNINYNASAATVQTAVRTVATTLGLTSTDFTVSGAAGGPWTITCATGHLDLWIGNPLNLTKAADTALNQGLDVDVVQTARGKPIGTPDLMTFLPYGLPTPTLSNAQVNGVTGNLTGVYSYLISYYSSTLNIESPPSNAVEIGNFAGNYATLTWTNPTTLWFGGYFNGTSVPFGPVVDRVRIYRKRTGNVLAVGSVGDGVGADATWYFVAEVAANKATYRDNTLDTARTADIYPVQKQYPPNDANYVTVNQGRAYYASNSHIVWNSEAKKVGGIDNGELGFGYVANDSFSQAFDDCASDSQITALNHYEGQLVVATDERLFAGDVSRVDTDGIGFRNVPGAAGCASHWTMVETTPLPGDVITGALLLYFHPKGGMYQYNGSTAEPISREDIATTIKTLSPKTWQNIAENLGDPISWYYATTVVDGYRNIALTSCPKLAGGSKCLVYDLQTRTWLPWDISIRAWIVGREWTTSSDMYGRDLLMFTDGSSIFKMVDGADDDGNDFDWYMTLGQWSMGSAQQKALEQIVANFDIIDFDGASPTVTITNYSGPSSVAVGSRSMQLDANQSVQSDKTMVCRSPFHQIKISGTHSEGDNWPALTSLGMTFEKTGLWLK